MMRQPLYRAEYIAPAYALRFAWTGWLSGGPWAAMLDSLWEGLAALWETDGLRLLERSSSADAVQICFSTKPDVSPVHVAQRAKGRLQPAMRKAGSPAEFRRKVAVRSVGENTTSAIERYIASQVENSEYVDERFREFLQELIVVDESINLAQPTASLSGGYWYNLHVVLVADERTTMGDRTMLVRVRDSAQAIAAKKGYLISALSVMPDHVHLALRGTVETSPQEIALSFLNNLAYALGQKPVWKAGYYVGTFSEYDIGAIRRRVIERRGL
jgi:REP element-mobilizing transposase RayT